MNCQLAQTADPHSTSGWEAKFARMKADGVNPFVDPEGYRSYVAEREQAFCSELAKQSGG